MNQTGGKLWLPHVQLGPRPYFLVDSMDKSPLKKNLLNCARKRKNFEKSDWSIGHGGASMQFPEHTIASYSAALRMGAGMVGCDVTFTKDRELVCRSNQCDLHKTTNVILRPEFNRKCTKPFTPGEGAKCCTSDFTLAEIKKLCAKMESSDDNAETPEDFIGTVEDWRTKLYSYGCQRVATHKEYIKLVRDNGAKFIPELTVPVVEMPYVASSTIQDSENYTSVSSIGTISNYTQEDYAKQLTDEYIELGIDPELVWPASRNWADTTYWVKNTPFKHAVAVEENNSVYYLDSTELQKHIKDIHDAGVQLLAAPTWMLVDMENTAEVKKIIASNYTKILKQVGFDMIGFTVERSVPASKGGGYYYQTVRERLKNDGDMFFMLQALHREVGAVGVFSDWPATTTFYANCMQVE